MCVNNEVTLAQFSGTFNSVLKINQPYSAAILNTTLTPPIKVDDTMEISYSGITITGCLANNNHNIVFERGSTISSQYLITSKQSNLIIAKNNRANNASGTSKIKMGNCIINMPPSETIVPLTYTFKTNSLKSMSIVANLAAEAVFFDATDISLEVSDPQIGKIATYTFTIVIS